MNEPLRQNMNKNLPAPVVPEETLTLEQLELCVRGELAVVRPWMKGPDEPYPDWKYRLLGGDSRREYEAAKTRGWCGLDLRAWEKFCELNKQPHAYLYAARGRRCAYLTVGTPRGLELSRDAMDGLYAMLNAHVRKGHGVNAGCYGAYAQFPREKLDFAAELIGPVLDLVLENLRPKDLQRFYLRSKTGVDEYDASVGPDYADGDALARALERVRPEDVPGMAEGFVDQKERARLARELFKRLGLKKVGVRRRTGSMCFGVNVRLPDCRDRGPCERLTEILHAAFPDSREDWSVQ
jgi:hypothetical protein